MSSADTPVDRFVNPYTFVPLPNTVARRAPTLHDTTVSPEGDTLYSGTLTVRWVLQTPLLLPEFAEKEGWFESDKTLRVPGSAIKGAVRSLHETMFSGCLRIIDDTFVPGYRESTREAVSTANPPPNPEIPGGWTLAVVNAARDGRPETLQLCGDVVWVDSADLLDRWPGSHALPKTGDRLYVDGDRDTALGRTVFRRIESADVADESDSPGVPIEGTRVLLVTDTGVRRKQRRDGTRARCFWATGAVTARAVQFNPSGDGVDQRAWEEFQASCRGSRDRQELERDPGSQKWRSETTYRCVDWWHGASGPMAPIAARAVVSGLLFAGDVVWVRLEQGKVQQIKHAAIWRKSGAGSVASRLPSPSLLPCPPETGELSLCLSCATFGAVEPTGKGSGGGRQDAYAGHVRFSSARSTEPPEPIDVELAPQGTPHAGAGMFYLAAPASLRNDRSPGDKASWWGIQPGVAPSRIRGRKFYWHSDPDEQAQYWEHRIGVSVKPRYEATSAQRARQARRTAENGGGMGRSAKLVPKGTELMATVAIDRLDAVAVHALLCAIEPQRLLRRLPESAGRTFGVHLGGGKAFGLGGATSFIERIDLRPVRQRYGAGMPDPAPSWPDGVPMKDIHERVGNFTRNLPALARILDLKGLDDRERPLVSYPPGATWDQVGTQSFGESYQFFQRANGEQLTGYSRPWWPLPDVAPGNDQTLPIVTRDGRS